MLARGVYPRPSKVEAGFPHCCAWSKKKKGGDAISRFAARAARAMREVKGAGSAERRAGLSASARSCRLSAERERRIHPHAKHRPRRQPDSSRVAAIRAAAADENARERGHLPAARIAPRIRRTPGRFDFFLLNNDPFASRAPGTRGANRYERPLIVTAIRTRPQAAPPDPSGSRGSTSSPRRRSQRNPRAPSPARRSSRRSTLVVASKRSSTLRLDDIESAGERRTRCRRGFSFGFCERDELCWEIAVVVRIAAALIGERFSRWIRPRSGFPAGIRDDCR